MNDISTPLVSSRRTVEDAWIDLNGHLNMAYYGVLFDRTADDVFEVFGMGPGYLERTNCSTFMLEAKFTYLRELHAGDEVTSTLQVRDVSDKCLHYFQELHHAEDGWTSAVMESLVIHIDMSTRKPAPFADDVQQQLMKIHEAHKSHPVPPQVGNKIGIRRK